ncbi:hypothetical protein, partial [Pseudomonas aeruginosa]|uniref:hypothetical protein n=1 Tax=Pseudomonas aeruginosa TaxID=287 RepID=UPI00197BC2F1
CQSGVWQSADTQGCYFMTVNGSGVLFRGTGMLDGGRFSGTMLTTAAPNPAYFGYGFDCGSDTSCVAARGSFATSIGGSGSFHSVLYVAALPLTSASPCY